MSVKKNILRELNNFQRDELGDIQPSVFDGRYEVGKDGEVIEHFARFMDAVNCALRHGDGTEIFDRMAHVGTVKLWHIDRGFARIVSYR